ncbi:hypothetical protein HT576_06585 [Haloterrigena sp. SYSU A121-1]|uniref:Uncharacterized protein n=1 Tax=Haloterrigena gelatinilytica TaxID=2741724 RepID=A0A8J8KAW4_9EURY|nr:hypothetical protein [Haloterrigena gelatinilytica]NUB90685.1 hypothetical protein [Haloterrigena gelatinilytica]
MDATDPRDPITDVRLEEPDLPVYLPGTPTVSFTEYVELAIDSLRRRRL